LLENVPFAAVEFECPKAEVDVGGHAFDSGLEVEGKRDHIVRRIPSRANVTRKLALGQIVLLQRGVPAWEQKRR